MRYLLVAVLSWLLIASSFEMPDGPDQVTSASGDEFVISLKAIPTTGYAWGLTSCPGNVEYLGNSVLPPTSALAGAPTQHEFRFKALRGGSGTVSFELKRPWEKEPIKWHDVTVKVQ